MHIKKSSIHETDIRSSLARFQLTPPVRCDQMHRLGRARGCISTHAPRVRCDGKGFISKRQTRLISTHAPRVRCDALVRVAVLYALRISTHAPRVRCDAPNSKTRSEWTISTHAPRVRCDHPRAGRAARGGHFNSRTSCEVRLGFNAHMVDVIISTHAPRVRCDLRTRFLL